MRVAGTQALFVHQGRGRDDLILVVGSTLVPRADLVDLRYGVISQDLRFVRLHVIFVVLGQACLQLSQLLVRAIAAAS